MRWEEKREVGAGLCRPLHKSKSSIVLLLKVASLGIGGKLFDWISNWLLSCTQRVCINGIVSLWKLVLSGIPQTRVGLGTTTVFDVYK